MSSSYGAGDMDSLEFFAVDDLMDITWGHAVNSWSHLNQSIIDGINFFEADILLENQGLPNETNIPIMAHPPDVTSDITLRQWLSVAVPERRGLKLDIKYDSAVEEALKVLQQFSSDINQPVWINADIFDGPRVNQLRPARNGTALVQLVQKYFPRCTLSLGWVTESVPSTHPGYSRANVEEAERFCRSLAQPVTFPIRTSLARRSWTHLSWLLNQSSRYSLTFWTSSSDTVLADDLVYIRKNSKPNQVYFDLPEPLIREVRSLESSARATRHRWLYSLTAVTLAVLFYFIYN